MRITIERNGRSLTLLGVWSEELGCFVGHWEHLPQVKRTGRTEGELMDALTALQDESVAVLSGLVFDITRN